MKGQPVSELYYQHPGTWFGDCMPLYADGAFQLFHQRDTRRPEPFGEPFGWALARTTDFVRFEDLGEALEKGADDAQDQFIFAGSAFEAYGQFHALFTAYNRDYPAQGRASQVLAHAVSDDLRHWTKLPGQMFPPEPGYDPTDWRDPFVLRDEENDRWVMILGARTSSPKLAVTGRTVWFTSPDLEHWDFQGDFWAPGLFTMHEMPDLFRIGERWYLLTTEYSDRSKTVYRMARSLEGPWSAPVDDAFDGRAYYAARSASDGEHRYLFGWVATKEGDDDLGAWQWGGTLVVHEVYQRTDGSLGVRIPDSVASAFTESRSLLEAPVTVAAPDGQQVVGLGELPADEPFIIRLHLDDADTRAVSIRLFGDEVGDAYAFTLRQAERRLDFDRVPNWPWYRYDNRGLERPFVLEPGQGCDIEIVADGTIATLYVDGVALNARMYQKTGTKLGLAVTDGSVTIRGARILTMRA